MISIEDIEIPRIREECHDPSIMKNDVWDAVPRDEGKFVVTSKWNYQIKHVADGSIEKCKSDEIEDAQDGFQDSMV
jgi:hypothetical protein